MTVLTTWYSLDLGDGVTADAASSQIRDAWLKSFIANGQPADFAVFSRYEFARNVVTAYFSPRAQPLAALFGATPCPAPSPTGLGLLAGPPIARELLFPGETAQALHQRQRMVDD